MSLLKATFPLNNSFIDKKQFEDTKGKYRQYKCQMKKGQMDKQWSDRAKDSATRTPQKTVNKQGCYGMVSSSGSTSDTRRVTVKRQETSYDMEILLDTSIRK